MFMYEQILNSKYTMFCMESVHEGNVLNTEKDNLRPSN